MTIEGQASQEIDGRSAELVDILRAPTEGSEVTLSIIYKRLQVNQEKAFNT